MQSNDKSSLKKAIGPLASVLVVLLLFGLLAFGIIGLKFFAGLLSLAGIGWAILGMIHPDRITSGSPEQNAKDRTDILFRCRLLLIVCSLLLVLIFVSRHAW